MDSRCFVHLNGAGLQNTQYRISRAHRATVAFFGGSITHMQGWRDLVMQYLRQRFPQTDFTFIDAGIPSLGSLAHVFRMQQDVLHKGRIDLLFVEAAVNDRVNGTPVTQQRRALEGIVRQARRANPLMDIIFMAFADEFKNADYAAGKVPAEVRVHEDIARYYQLPFINLSEEVYRRMAAGEFSWKEDFRNLHPSPFGHRLCLHTIGALLDSALAGSPSRPLPRSLPPACDALNYEQGAYAGVNQVDTKGFVYTPSWHPADTARTRPGFVGVPALVGSQPGQSFQLDFSGTLIGLAFLAGPDAGRIAWSVDNAPQQTLDLFTSYSRSLHLPRYELLADGLAPGRHRFVLTILPGHDAASTGNACRIVHFLVNAGASRMRTETLPKTTP